MSLSSLEQTRVSLSSLEQTRVSLSSLEQTRVSLSSLEQTRVSLSSLEQTRVSLFVSRIQEEYLKNNYIDTNCRYGQESGFAEGTGAAEHYTEDL